MENVDGFTVEREGNQIHISFYDIFGVGEVYIFSVGEARRIKDAIEQCLYPDFAGWENEGGSWLNDSC